MKKRSFSLLVILILVLSMSISAFAASPKYKSTDAFIAAMEDNGYEFDFYEEENSGDGEMVITEFAGDYMDYICISTSFPETGDEMTLFSFDLITFDKSDYYEMLEVVNQLNYKYGYCCFYVDKEYDTVCVSWNVLLGEADAKEISDIAFHTFLNVVDYSYQTLAPFAVSQPQGSI